MLATTARLLVTPAAAPAQAASDFASVVGEGREPMAKPELTKKCLAAEYERLRRAAEGKELGVRVGARRAGLQESPVRGGVRRNEAGPRGRVP